MLEKIDLSKKMDDVIFHQYMDDLTPKLASLQRECRDLEIPIVIIFEGLGASGKGTLINQLIRPLDPRGFQVFAINGESAEEQMRPFLWRFWTKLPERGRIAIFDRSWYRRVLVDRYDKITTNEQLESAYDEINSFEKQLSDDGMLILKFFLYISQEEQSKRFQNLLANKETAWRVTKQDQNRNENYDKYIGINEEMLQKTDTDYAKWNIIEAMDKKFATVKIMTTVLEWLSESVETKKSKLNSDSNSRKKISNSIHSDDFFKASILNKVKLDQMVEKKEYKNRLNELKNKLGFLHSEIYRRRIPVVLVFEGWDAGGKGGAIKRLTENLDPRGYDVYPTSAPNDVEKSHHYLWRFWNHVPKAGHIGIFDRSWYGRVLVERVEGFCTQEEYQRAYKEINIMEESWSNSGTVILKFWMQIGKGEQLKRFKERQNNPEKQWKITEEDWRNREKWDLYEEAVDEMLIRTSTTYAPWTIVEANSKYYARIKVLETVLKVLEERLA